MADSSSCARPPLGVLTMVGTLAGKTHRTMHYCDTDETMVSPSWSHIFAKANIIFHQLPLFDKDTNGSSNKMKYIMGKRNWTSVLWDDQTGDLIFDIRVEIEKGNGVTKGYVLIIDQVSRRATDFVPVTLRAHQRQNGHMSDLGPYHTFLASIYLSCSIPTA